MIEKDVLIVGGGPAGSSCAWRLAQHGLDVLILDKAKFPRTKPCAGWVTPEVFKTLQIDPGEYPYGLIHFDSFNMSIKGIKFKMRTNQYAIRRWEFDQWLLTRSGVTVEQHQVKEIKKVEGRYILDGKYSAQFLIGAGGTHCPVRAKFNPRRPRSNQKGLIIAKEEEFLYPERDPRCHLWFFEGGLPGYAWFVPKAAGYLNVGIGGSATGLKARKRTLEDHWQRLIEKLDHMGLVQGHVFQPLGYSYFLNQSPYPVQIENVFFVGDSLGLATRDMGEGIGPAIQSGILAADSIVKGLEYSTKSISRYSLPSLLRLRK